MPETGPLTVDEIAHRFATGTLPEDAWTHRAHLAVALWNLRRFSRPEAARRVREGILRHNARAGRDGGYHETITLAWLAIVALFLEQQEYGRSDDDLLAALAARCDDSRYLQEFYSRERLMSETARHAWIPPDHSAPWSRLAEQLAARPTSAGPVDPSDANEVLAKETSPDTIRPENGPRSGGRLGACVCAGVTLALLLGTSGGLPAQAKPQRTQSAGSQPRSPVNDVEAFLRRYCYECHRGSDASAKLSLPDLPSVAEQPSRWIPIHDMLKAKRMPPRDALQPAANEREQVTLQLGRQLQASSLVKQQRDGRVMLRRLNRTEYETTLRDLLGAQVAVKDLLPGDNTAAGFDNVSTALDVSSAHLLRFQEAAERALRTVIPRQKPDRLQSRLTGRQVFEKQRQAKELLGKCVALDGDTLIQYVKPWSHISFGTATVRQDGRYRVRASVSAKNTAGRPLPVRFTVGWDWGRSETQTLAVRDAAADRPTEIEIEVDLKARSRELVDVTGWTLHTERQHREGPNKDKPFDSFPGLAIHWLEIEGPLEPWPPVGYTRLFGDLPFKQQYAGAPLEVDSRDPRGDAERLLRAFLPIAFRRPVDAERAEHYIGIVHAALDRKQSFEEAMLLGYRAVLCSPHFLFLTEPIGGSVPPGKLDDFAVAARLSYLLWSSTPDDVLLDLAARRELSQPLVLRAQVERMLADPRSSRFVDHFAGQWLDLRQINATTPDPEVYGEFDPFLAWSLPLETRGFFETILREDRSLLEFVHSDWTLLNERLAQHYGIPGVFGGELRRVELPPDSHRGGVLTQAAILKVTADGTKTSPVLRGKWVLERIVGQTPAPPPPGVAAIEPDIRGTTTIREQLDKHRDVESCAVCHRHIDPPGFALESFDVIGGWRTFYRGTVVKRELWTPLANYPGRQVVRGPDVDPSGWTPDGAAFRDIDAYKQILLADPDQLTRSLAEKLAVYATGADLQFADREVIEQIVATSRGRKRGFRSLLHDVVQSRLFLHK